LSRFQQDNTVDPKKTFDIVNTPQDNVAYEDFNKNVYNMQKPMQSWRSYFKQYNIA
jgi:hypothetical protein